MRWTDSTLGRQAPPWRYARHCLRPLRRAFALWPGATRGFFNARFHGVDLRVLQPTTRAFTPGIFLYGLSDIVLTGFVMGAIYAVMVNLVRRGPGCL